VTTAFGFGRLRRTSQGSDGMPAFVGMASGRFYTEYAAKNVDLCRSGRDRVTLPRDFDIDIDGDLEHLPRINDVGIADLGLVGFKDIDVVEAIA